jgi:hypothetical protein
MISRRTFITAGLLGAAALVTARWVRGPHAPPGDATVRALDADAQAILRAVVPVLLAGALPEAAAAKRAAVGETVRGIDIAVTGLPPSAQEELRQLFALLAVPPGRLLIARISQPWNEADEADVRACLDRFRELAHDAALAYGALHQLTFAAWYGNPVVAADRVSGPRPFRMTTLPKNPIRSRPAWASGWKVIDASTLAEDITLDADVAIVGSGAGGGTAAEILADAGLTVVVLGRAAQDFKDFRMRDRTPIRSCIRNPRHARRGQGDQHLQGRCVGGTTVNWTSSFGRRPPHSHSGNANSASRDTASTTWRRGSRRWKRACRLRPGTSPPTRTTKRWRAAREKSASRPRRSAAT